MEPILQTAAAHGLSIVEDAAQAIGALDERGRQAGTSGHVGCFSFFPSKNLGAYGDAGMAVTHHKKLAETLRTLRVHGSKPMYHHQLVGGNFRLDALQAAVLRVKLSYLPSWTEARRKNAQQYRRVFEQEGLLDCVMLPEEAPGHSYHQFVVRVPDRDCLQAFLWDCGIGTEVYYPLPLHLQECFKDLGYRQGDFPHAERAAAESLALPIYAELTEAQQRYVVEQIKAFYKRERGLRCDPDLP
jgi:dTDP-4-amino-4,6-dideoxygalactose transaminase